jgi:hypothetical protein
MIRKAEFKDLSQCVKLLLNFSNQITPNLFEFPEDKEAHFKAFLFNIMSNPSYCIFVDNSVSSILVGQIGVSALSNKKLANETLWWIEPDARSLQLAQAHITNFVGWSRVNGADYVGMSEELSLKSPGALYKRAGFHALETTYIRRL